MSMGTAPPASVTGSAGSMPGEFAQKYGFNETDVERAGARSIAFMAYLTGALEAQQAHGSEYLIGDTLTAADFYWAAFSNVAVIAVTSPPPSDALPSDVISEGCVMPSN